MCLFWLVVIINARLLAFFSKYLNVCFDILSWVSSLSMKIILYKTKRMLFKFLQNLMFNPKTFWNRQGGKTYFNKFDSKIGERNEDIFLKYIEKHKPSSIIDIGCGYGRYLKIIKNKFPNIELVGMDISETQINFAKNYLSDDSIQLYINDCKKINYDNKYFDLVITYGCLGHIPKKSVKKVFNEMKRISKNMLLIETERKIKSKASHVYHHNYDILFGNNLFTKKKLNALGDTLFRIIND